MLCLSKSALESVVNSEEKWYVSGINMCFEVDFGEGKSGASESSESPETADASVPSAIQTILTSHRLRSINANWKHPNQQKYGHTGKPLDGPLVKGNMKVTITPHRTAPRCAAQYYSTTPHLNALRYT